MILLKGGVPDSLANREHHPAGHTIFDDILGSLNHVDVPWVGLAAIDVSKRNSSLALWVRPYSVLLLFLLSGFEPNFWNNEEGLWVVHALSLVHLVIGMRQMGGL